jgi:hypothetical protein
MNAGSKGWSVMKLKLDGHGMGMWIMRAGLAASLCVVGCDGSAPSDEGGSTPAATGAVDSLGRPLGPITSRIVADNAANASKMNLLARLEVQPNEMLEFYEPIPGSILIGGGGAPAGPMMFNSRSDLSVEAFWQQAASRAPMPAALAQAVGRAKLVPAAPIGGGETKSERGGGGLSGAALTVPSAPRGFVTQNAGGFCDNGYWTSGDEVCPYRTAAALDCLDNWMDGRSDSYGPASAERAQVCPATGSVVLRLQTYNTNTGLVIGSWQQNVAQNTVNWWIWTSIPNRPLVHADVLQAAGVRFQWIFAAWATNPPSVWN